MHTLASLLGKSALVTKEFRCTTKPEDGQYVRIVGRKSGLIDWLLSLIGINSTTTFEVHRDRIRFTKSNFSGQMTTMIPMHSISNTSTGYFRPVLYLIIGVLLLPSVIVLDWGINLVPFGLGIGLLIYYFLHKSLMVSTQDTSGFMTFIAFKPSVIEGVKIGPEDAEKVISIINKLVLLSHPNQNH